MEMVTKREHRLKKIFHLKMIAKRVTSDKGYYIMIKGSIQQEDITIIDICEPNTGSQINGENTDKIERESKTTQYISIPHFNNG